MKIYAPVKDATGVYASVKFVDGVGETNNPALIEWFRQHGYRIEKTTVVAAPISEVSHTDQFSHFSQNDEVEPSDDAIDFESMTPDELRRWAKGNGLGSQIGNTRSKDKLLKIIRG